MKHEAGKDDQMFRGNEKIQLIFLILFIEDIVGRKRGRLLGGGRESRLIGIPDGNGFQ